MQVKTLPTLEEFDPSCVYKFTLTSENFRIPFLTFEQSLKTLSDGRVSGLIVEDMIMNMFSATNPFEKSHPAAEYDLLHKSGSKYECKTIGKGGGSPLPSKMKGTQRKYDKAAYITQLQSLDYFILVDMGHLPEITFLTLSPEDPLFWIRKDKPRRFITRNQLTKKYESIK